jgi:hypothetical protein
MPVLATSPFSSKVLFTTRTKDQAPGKNRPQGCRRFSDLRSSARGEPGAAVICFSAAGAPDCCANDQEMAEAVNKDKATHVNTDFRTVFSSGPRNCRRGGGRFGNHDIFSSADQVASLGRKDDRDYANSTLKINGQYTRCFACATHSPMGCIIPDIPLPSVNMGACGKKRCFVGPTSSMKEQCCSLSRSLTTILLP